MERENIEVKKVVVCPKCGSKLLIAPQQFDQKGRCNKCNHIFIPKEAKPAGLPDKESIPSFSLEPKKSLSIASLLKDLFYTGLATTLTFLSYYYLMLGPESGGDVFDPSVVPNRILSGLIIFVMIPAYYWSRRSPEQATSLANIITVLGIFGTFCGIALGLYFFDVTRIEESIPSLLNGLKTAFLTSIAGILIATFIRTGRLIAAHRKPEEEANVTNATLDTIANILIDTKSTNESNASELRLVFQKQFEYVGLKLDSITTSICGDGETTLLTQFQKLRTAFSDKQDQLIDEFRRFAETMVENNSKALIEALEGVIRDFNQKITEQFGENFKQLNEGVAKLVEWQDNYRKTLEELEARLKTQVEASERLAASQEHIALKSDHLVHAAQNLEDILTGLVTIRDDLNLHLAALAGVADKASNAFPMIESNIVRLTKDFSDSVEIACEKNKESITAQNKNLETILASMNTLTNTTQNSIQNCLTETTKAIKQFTEDSSTALKEHRDSLRSSIEESLKVSSKNMDDFTKEHKQVLQIHSDQLHESILKCSRDLERYTLENGQKLQHLFSEFDKQLQEELTKSLVSLGTALASLSQQFVSDYKPLTDQLRSVVRIAEGISTR